MKIRIKRFDGTKQYISTYEVPAEPDESVMNILDYIYFNLDSTLAYYRHSICDQGICGRCGLKVNGKNVLACVYRPESEEILLEPRAGTVVRDLVVR